MKICLTKKMVQTGGLNQHRFNLIKKIILVGVVLVMAGGMILPNIVFAQPGTPTPTIPLSQAPTEVMAKVKDTVQEKIFRYLKTVSAVAYKNALKNFLGQLAQRFALQLTSGLPGQKPHFETNFGEFLEDQANGALGDYLNDTLGQWWGKNLCDPLDPLAKVRLEVTARKLIQPGKPRCDFRKIVKNVEDLKKLKLNQLVEFSDYFNPSGNDLGILLTITTGAKQVVNEKKELTQWQKLVEGSFKPLTNVITGDIKTPAKVYDSYTGLLIGETVDQYKTYTGEAVADAVGIFTNTLTNRLLQSFFVKGLYQPQATVGGYGPLYTGSNVQAAKERFANLAVPDYNFGGSLDLAATLGCGNTESIYNCTADSQLITAVNTLPHITVKEAMSDDYNLLHAGWPVGYRADKSGGTDIISKSIYSARTLTVLRKYRIIPVGWELAAEYYKKYDRSGEALTLQILTDAYDDPNSPYYKLVDPNWVLKLPEVICEKEGAGELSDRDSTVSMPVADAGGVMTGNKKEIITRYNYCADERSCIKEGEQGCEYYGYCTKEKPIWKIESENGECSPIFNSCEAYTKRVGKSQVGYLTNTLYGLGRGSGDVECEEADVGCREYCNAFDLDRDEGWSCTATSTPVINDRIFLNKEASETTCGEDQWGCSNFIRVKTARFVATTTTYETGLLALQEAVVGSFDTIIDYEKSRNIKLRKAPDYLGCQGYTTIVSGVTASTTCEATAPRFWRSDIDKCVGSGAENCRDFALYCSANEADCKIYKPVSYEGPSVPGVISASDQCPSECVGYKYYMEQPSFLEPVVLRNPIRMIPTSGKTCPAADNGCEEFTNMSEGAEGEKIQYYSAIRACVLPENGGVANYYTWASTAESGNQLKSWQLLAENADGTNTPGSGAPCTTPVTNDVGVVSCGATDPLAICTVGDADSNNNPIYNPDCVEFIDANGGSHWRKYSRIVPVDEDDCMPMRRTYNQGIYTVSPSKSKKCAASSAGCREYKGSGANNIKIILNDDFERPVLINGVSRLDQGWNNGRVENESLVANGRSYYAGDSINKEVTSIVHQGKSYKLSFWARDADNGAAINGIEFRGQGVVDIPFNDFANNETVEIGMDWQRYEFYLNNFNRAVATVENLYILLDDMAGLYIDNIILTETQDDVYLIKDSWKTPDVCTNEMLGCEAYKDAANKDWYLKSFTRLCRDEVVGCEAMIDTQNTTEPALHIFNNTVAPTSDDVTVPADELVYLVYDQNKKCSDVGCTMLGRIEPTRDMAAALNFTNKMMIVNPDKFGEQDSALCTADKLWCEKFTAIDGGGVKYFKDPNAFACEYKMGSTRNYGWFVTGTTEACPSLPTNTSGNYHCVGGRSVIDGEEATNGCNMNSGCVDYAVLNHPAVSGICSNYAGLCPIKEDNCSEYQDPTTPKNCDKDSVYGENFNESHNQGTYCDYYYYKSDKINKSECKKINPDQGCRGFHETGGGSDRWYATLRCQGDPSVECKSPADCENVDGKNIGPCGYDPQIGLRLNPNYSDGPQEEETGEGNIITPN